MTRPDYTGMLLVIDRSGSMTSIRDDMIGGLTTMLAEQAAEPGRLTVDIVTFDDTIEQQCSMADPATVQVRLDPRGSTALFDAIGVAVGNYGRVLAELPEDERPETVQVVVVTDGMENASREYTVATVRDLVRQQQEQYGWDFVFLGANQDAVLTGTELGFDIGSSMTYAAAPEGVATSNAVMSRYIKDVRSKSKQAFTADERDRSVQSSGSAR